MDKISGGNVKFEVFTDASLENVDKEGSKRLR